MPRNTINLVRCVSSSSQILHLPILHILFGPSFRCLQMELPTKAPDSRVKKTQYTIKTKKLSCSLPRSGHGCSGLFRKGDNAGKSILKNVNCEARPGEIMAIAGVSGAGKTTLLEVLAGVIPLSRLAGNVLVNDQPMEPRRFRRVSGYVTQDEILFPLLTVEETLMYSARLRLHNGGHKKAAARVRELLNELGLEHVAKVRIGGESNRGISGGEKRRVSIGVDLVHDPAVLLIDEPTSGLDSASALHVALLLKAMATQGKTIVLTIHQPGSRILELFDQALLLSNGTVVHNGSLNLLEQRLQSAGHSIPPHVNILEFAIEVAEALVIDAEENDKENADVEQDCENVRRNHQICNVKETNIGYANHQLKEVLILGQRFSSNIFRTKQLFLARTLQAIFAGFVFGTIFKNAGSDSMRYKLQIGFFASSLAFLLSSTTEGLPIYLQERRILMRETSRGAYRISSYVISNTLVFLPFLLLVALLYTVPVYWLVALRSEINAFLYFLLVVWMVLLMSNSFVSCFSALVPDFIMGSSLTAALIGSFFLFSGYFISKEDIPSYWIFMHHLSLFKYPLESFMINEFGGERGKKRCFRIVEGQCYLYGEGFLRQKGLKESEKWSNIAVMLSFIIGYRFLSILILRHRSYRTKS